DSDAEAVFGFVIRDAGSPAVDPRTVVGGDPAAARFCPGFREHGRRVRAAGMGEGWQRRVTLGSRADRGQDDVAVARLPIRRLPGRTTVPVDRSRAARDAGLAGRSFR